MPLLNYRNINLMLDGCRKNNRKSQLELYQQLYGFATEICCRYTDSQEECVELVNGGFFRLFKDFSQFRGATGPDLLASLQIWFRRILINCCVEHYRTANSSPTIKIDNSINAPRGLEPIEAIRALPPVLRTAFNLFVFEELTYKEISRLLNISLKETEDCLLKARAELKMLMSDGSTVAKFISEP